MESDDARLLQAIGKGSRTAFTTFYERYADRVYRYCHSRLQNAEAAKDACQETLIAVWQGAGTYDGRGSPTAWLFGIAYRRVQDMWRRLGRQPALAADDTLIQIAASDELAAVDQRLDLKASLARLSPEHQETVLLTYQAGLTCREIAGITGVPEGTVKSRLYHARQALGRSFRR